LWGGREEKKREGKEKEAGDRFVVSKSGRSPLWKSVKKAQLGLKEKQVEEETKETNQGGGQQIEKS